MEAPKVRSWSTSPMKASSQIVNARDLHRIFVDALVNATRKPRFLSTSVCLIARQCRSALRADRAFGSDIGFYVSVIQRFKTGALYSRTKSLGKIRLYTKS
jgi:hypothetical protein